MPRGTGSQTLNMNYDYGCLFVFSISLLHLRLSKNRQCRIVNMHCLLLYILEIKFDIYSNSETFNFLQTQQTFGNNAVAVARYPGNPLFNLFILVTTRPIQ